MLVFIREISHQPTNDGDIGYNCQVLVVHNVKFCLIQRCDPIPVLSKNEGSTKYLQGRSGGVIKSLQMAFPVINAVVRIDELHIIEVNCIFIRKEF